MGVRKVILAWACLAIYAAELAAVHVKGYKSSQDAALRCLVNNAVTTRLAPLPTGMLIDSYVASSTFNSTADWVQVNCGISAMVDK